MKHFRLILSILILLVSVVLCQQIISKSISNQRDKQDNAEINHIKYGLFSINSWKEKLIVIITDELQKFNLSNTHEHKIKRHLEVQLDKLIDQVYLRIQDSYKGTVKGWAFKRFVDVDVIKGGIPQYADTIMAEMTKAKTEAQLKSAIKKQLQEYFDKTFQPQDMSQLNRILESTQTENIDAAKVLISERIVKTQEQIFHLSWILMVLAFVLFAMASFYDEKIPAPIYIILILCLVNLLAAGVTIPMIDMEAKISQMSFVLLDHPINFLNQILYFQSKSILDVFWIMVLHHELKMKIVGILMVAFSVFFPLLKMISSLIYYYDFKGAQANRLVQFFVFKSGKWSMTDVLVVAIFMAYIGFNGIISSQFGNFSTTEQDLVILTTNGTSLQPGFYLFMTYALLALFLSGFLVKNSKTKI